MICQTDSLILPLTFSRWENTDTDILKCTECKAALCVAFHPSLDKKSQNQINQQYFDMLSSCHEDVCIFKSYSARWLKVMKRQCSLIENEPENKEDCLERKTRKSFESMTTYVPPHFLTLSNEFLRFEDYSKDGSITHNLVEEGSSIMLTLFSMLGGFRIPLPDALTKYCIKISPAVVVDKLVCSMKSSARLLSTFGWHADDNTIDDEGCIVQCKICLAQAFLSSIRKHGPPQKKQRRDTMEDARINLIDSHRVYCPYVLGFSFGPEHHTVLSGWKVIVSNLVKYNQHFQNNKLNDSVSVCECLWGEDC